MTVRRRVTRVAAVEKARTTRRPMPRKLSMEAPMLAAMLRSIAIIACVALGGARLGAAVQDAEGRATELFNRIDTNHDGVIQLSEWLAWREHQREHRQGEAGEHGDAPPNGRLTMAGLSHTGAPVGAGTPPTAGGAPGPSAGAPASAGAPDGERRHEGRYPLFDRIDTNHDGVIELSEWLAFAAARRHHHRPDAPVTPGPVLPATTPSTTTAGTPAR
jgi:hypothetical protein